MLMMSISDILGSVAMGLTTLPMPSQYHLEHDKDLDLKEEWRAGAVGTRIGNQQTCTAQGLLFVFGVTVMFVYNGMLCLYYTCAIAFRMREEKIVKYVEPFLHLFPVVVGLICALVPLFYGWYNDPLGWEAWCTITGSNNNTIGADEDEGPLLSIATFDMILTITIASLLSQIVGCLLFIISRVLKNERKLQDSNRITRRGEKQIIRRFESPLRKAYQSHGNTKVILVQALAYIASFGTTLLPALLRTVIEESLELRRLHATIMPLQGFFNALIFFSHKIYCYNLTRPKEDNEESNRNTTSCCHIFYLLFIGRAQEPVLFSRISSIDSSQMNNSVIVWDIEIEDEFSVDLSRFILDMDVSFDEDSGNDVFLDDDKSKFNDLSGHSSMMLSTGVTNAEASTKDLNRQFGQLQDNVHDLSISSTLSSLKVNSTINHMPADNEGMSSLSGSALSVDKRRKGRVSSKVEGKI